MSVVVRDKNRGSVLVLVLMFMVTAVIMTTAYLAMINSDTINFNSQSNSEHAFYIAEAGIHKAVWYLLNTAPDNTVDGSWRTSAYPAASGQNSNDPQEESFGGGSYTMWVENFNGSILITSSGIYNGTTRTVHELEDQDSTGPNTFHRVAGSWGIN